MANARRGRVPKSPEEKRAYQENVIRPKPSPTVDSLPFSDSTTALTHVDETSTTTTATPRHSESRGLFAALRARWHEAGGLALLLGFLGWMAYQVYGLNREVGELKQRLDAIDKGSADYEERMQHRLDRVEDRLDRRDERTTTPPQGHPSPAPKR